jgi:hypothetical protein
MTLSVGQQRPALPRQPTFLIAVTLEMNLRRRNETAVHTLFDVRIRPKIVLLIDLYPERKPVLKISEFNKVVTGAGKQTFFQRLTDIRICAKIITLVNWDVF